MSSSMGPETEDKGIPDNSTSKDAARRRGPGGTITETATTKSGAALPLYLALLALLCAFSLHETISLDIGWHIRAGEYILENLAVPGTDIFSYTATDRPYLDSHWLFQVLAYIFSALAGEAGLTLLVLLPVAGTFILVAKVAGFLRSPVSATFFLGLFILASGDRFIARPELVSFLFIAAYLLILERRPGTNTGTGIGTRALFFIPVLQVLWVNSHGLFILGVVVVGCFLSGAVIEYVIREKVILKKGAGAGEWARDWAAATRADVGHIKRLAIIFVLTVLAALLNPYGLTLALYPFTIFTEVSSAENIVRTTVVELTSPFSGSELLNGEAVFFYKALALASASALLINVKRIRPAHVLLFVAFFYLSTLAVRNIVLFSVVAAPLAVINLRTAGAAGFLVPGMLRGLKFIAASFFFVVIAYYLVSIASNDYYLRNSQIARSGMGPSEVRYPVGALDFIEENNIKGNVFNGAGMGGYFIWRMYPERKVFFDGRWEVYGDDFMRLNNAALKDPQTFERVARAYAIEYTLLGYGAGTLLNHLIGSEQWAPVYCGRVGLVFVRTIGVNRGVNRGINRGVNRGINRGINQGLAKGEAKGAGIGSGCGFIIAEAPGAPEIKALEQAYEDVLYEGFPSRAWRLLRLFSTGNEGGAKGAEAGFSNDPQPPFNRATLLGALGRPELARVEYLKSLALYPHQHTAHFNLGAAYMDMGLNEKAAEEFRLAMEANPRNLMAKKFLDFLGGDGKKGGGRL